MQLRCLLAIAAGASRLGTRRGPQIIDEINQYFSDIVVSETEVAAFVHH
ncbi:MAG: hypothetical protein WCC87_07445 [Candidatus Korobacteraceae bacterium]